MCYSLRPVRHQMETDENLSLNPEAPCFVPKIQHTVKLYNSNVTGEEETAMCPITRTASDFSPPLDTPPSLATTGTPQVTPPSDPSNDQQQLDNSPPDSEPLELPTTTLDDYMQDPEFKDIYNYIVTGELTDNELINRQTLLISEQYFVRDNLLYKIGLPSILSPSITLLFNNGRLITRTLRVKPNLVMWQYFVLSIVSVLGPFWCQYLI